jgi:hypothetical protein
MDDVAAHLVMRTHFSPCRQVGLDGRATACCGAQFEGTRWLGQWLGEAIAAVGLLASILLAQRATTGAIIAHKGIGLSVHFEHVVRQPHPVVRGLISDTFSGIAPSSAAGFVAATAAGAEDAAGMPRTA